MYNREDLLEKLLEYGHINNEERRFLGLNGIRKEEIEKLIFKYLLTFSVFPYNVANEKSFEGCLIKKSKLLGYFLICRGYYGKYCRRAWFLSNKSAIKEFIKREYKDQIDGIPIY